MMATQYDLLPVVRQIASRGRIVEDIESVILFDAADEIEHLRMENHDMRNWAVDGAFYDVYLELLDSLEKMVNLFASGGDHEVYYEAVALLDRIKEPW